jgi:hypothetical protein
MKADRESEKPCSKCGQLKPISVYYRNGAYLRAECKDCTRVQNQPRYRSERYRAYKQDSYFLNRDECIARSDKNRIERKFPYLRSPEFKKRAIEDYRRHTANKVNLVSVN